jgi:tetratricopeptide (TPR) repeat protein
MRARLAAAQTLETMGRAQEAIDHYRELLRLNPNDNQGVRYVLLPTLLEQRRDQEVGSLLDEYEGDIQALWAYGRSLWLFRTEGDSARARAALQEATQINRHVVGYLLGPDSIPWRAPHFALGSKEEAAYAADELLDAFEQTSGALTWLRARAGHLGARKRRK